MTNCAWIRRSRDDIKCLRNVSLRALVSSAFAIVACSPRDVHAQVSAETPAYYKSQCIEQWKYACNDAQGHALSKAAAAVDRV